MMPAHDLANNQRKPMADQLEVVQAAVGEEIIKSAVRERGGAAAQSWLATCNACGVSSSPKRGFSPCMLLTGCNTWAFLCCNQAHESKKPTLLQVWAFICLLHLSALDFSKLQNDFAPSIWSAQLGKLRIGSRAARRA